MSGRKPGKTREQWMRAAALEMGKWVNREIKTLGEDLGCEADGYQPDKVHVGIGWPRGGGKHVIGLCHRPECHPEEHAKAGWRTIFISPVHKDTVEVLATLLHEMCHAALPSGVAHSKPFKALVRSLGLAGKATATYAEADSVLHKRLVALAAKLGPLEHVPLLPTSAAGGKGQSKWARITSPSLEGFHAQISMKSLFEHGMPAGPDGLPLVVKDPAKFLLMAAELGHHDVDRRWFGKGGL